MPDAVLLLAHGTPDRVEEIPEYLSRVTGGRPLPPAVTEEVSHRFSLIGGSPLTPLTLQQGSLLQQELGLPVYVGMRNWKPYIADVVHQMRADGITRAVVICLAPQNSRTSVGLYRRAAFAAAEGAIELRFLDDWDDHPQLIAAFAERLRDTRDPFITEIGEPIPVLFTAHSVPCRTIISTPSELSSRPEPAQSAGTAEGPVAKLSSRPEPAQSAGAAEGPGARLSSRPEPAQSAGAAEGLGARLSSRPEPAQSAGAAEGPAFSIPDPYPIEAKLTAQLVAAQIPGLTEHDWFFAFQSQGMSGGPWLGPTVEDTLTALRQQDVTNLVIQPIGFLCDHVEILYDIDIGFREYAANLGITIRRPASLNDSPLLTQALADLARRGLA